MQNKKNIGKTINITDRKEKIVENDELYKQDQTHKEKGDTQRRSTPA